VKTDVYINLPVNDLKKSVDFFKQLGFDFNSRFSNDQTACMILNNECYVMLLQEMYFRDFTNNGIADTSQFTEVLLAISVDSKEKVNSFLENALRMGAREAREPQDNNFMFGRSFHDLDGHIWEIFWMNPTEITQD
jgi:hypothetical protein